MLSVSQRTPDLPFAAVRRLASGRTSSLRSSLPGVKCFIVSSSEALRPVSKPMKTASERLPRCGARLRGGRSTYRWPHSVVNHFVVSSRKAAGRCQLGRSVLPKAVCRVAASGFERACMLARGPSGCQPLRFLFSETRWPVPANEAIARPFAALRRPVLSGPSCYHKAFQDVNRFIVSSASLLSEGVRRPVPTPMKPTALRRRHQRPSSCAVGHDTDPFRRQTTPW